MASRIGDVTGTIQAGKWADLTVLSLDPLNLELVHGDASQEPTGVGIPVRELLDGEIVMTVVAGNIVYRR